MLDLQMNPYVSDLALYDIQGTPGVAADISHINSKAKTKVTQALHAQLLCDPADEPAACKLPVDQCHSNRGMHCPKECKAI